MRLIFLIKARGLSFPFKAITVLFFSLACCEANEPPESLNHQLFEAAANGRLKEVENLLKDGASPNAKATKGMTPLMIAALNGHTEVVRLLLSSGADRTIKDDNGGTAFNYALVMEHSEIASLLEGKRYKLSFLIGAFIGLVFWPLSKVLYKQNMPGLRRLKRLFLFQLILLCMLSAIAVVLNLNKQVMLRIIAEASIFYLGILFAIASFILMVIMMRQSSQTEAVS